MREDVLLKPLTTFRCGGPAKYFDEPANEEEIINDLKFARDRGLPVFILGGGANCLISDKGFDGLVIKIGRALSNIEIEDKGDTAVVKAGAGILLMSFGMKIACMRHSRNAWRRRLHERRCIWRGDQGHC